MSYVTLEEAKSYSNIYFTEKDVEVEMMIGAAEGWLAKFLNRENLSGDDLIVAADSPAPDSPAAVQLLPEIKLLVLMAFEDFWQNRGTQVAGTNLAENPTFMRAAHLYRLNLGV